MKYVLLFEAFNKNDISLDEFKKLKIGTTVAYMGSRWEIKENNDGAVIILTKTDKNTKKEKTCMLNYAQFKSSAMIFTEEN